MALKPPTDCTRRCFLAGAAAAVGMIGAPSVSRAADRPLITHGIQSGDVSAHSGIVWARADRPARMLVEISASETFRHVRHATFVDALPETDFTAKALIEDLPAGRDVYYRIRLQDLSSPTLIGEQAVGRFRTAPDDCRSVSFLWSGDTGGQGWGIDESRGGMRTYATMLNSRPDFFIHCGDNIYADRIVPPQKILPNGEIWRNLITEDKSRPAETLAGFRGNYKYNLLDRNLRAFNAEVPTFALWDNHEVMEDWWPDKPLAGGTYVSRNALLLSARAARGPNRLAQRPRLLTSPPCQRAVIRAP
jgi:alkaline phosphatase D